MNSGTGTARIHKVPTYKVGVVVPLGFTSPSLLDLTRENLRSWNPAYGWMMEAGVFFSVYFLANPSRHLTREFLLNDLAPGVRNLVPWKVAVIDDRERGPAEAWNRGLQAAMADCCKLALVVSPFVQAAPGLFEALISHGRDNLTALIWGGVQEGKAAAGLDWHCLAMRDETIAAHGLFDTGIQTAALAVETYCELLTEPGAPLAAARFSRREGV